MDLGKRRRVVDTSLNNTRALTSGRPLRKFSLSGLSSFREYNKLYETWLNDRYRDEIEPYTNRSLNVLDPYLTETALGWMLEHKEMVSSMARKLEELESTPGLKEKLSSQWNVTGSQRREEIVLKIFEEGCRRVEAADCIWTREECPELTLEWVMGFDQEGVANWIRLWEQQRQTEEEREKSEKQGDLPFRNLRNERWDRVNGVFEIEKSPVPIKKSVRAFVQNGVLSRNFELRQFLQVLLATLASCSPFLSSSLPQSQLYSQSGIDMKAGVPIIVDSPLIVQRSASSEDKDEDDMISALQSQGVHIGVTRGREVVTCVFCRLEDNTKPIKLKCSSCWEKMNRSVRYCSISCQHQHWKTHKQVCGKPLKDTLNIPSFASSAPSTSSISSTSAHLSGSLDRLKLTSRSPGLKLRHTAHQGLRRYECTCWIDIKKDPDHYDPRQDVLVACIDAPRDAKSRPQLRRALRSIAFNFLEDEGGNERLLDLVVVLVSLIQGSTDSNSAHARWLAKMIGLEGKSLEYFINQGFSERLARAREIVRVDPEFQVIEEYLQARENDPSDSNEPEWVTTASVIRDDLLSDPEAIWYTSSPPKPELTRRIRGPVLEETSESEYAKGGNKFVLVEALRRQAFAVLEDLPNNLPSLGIILLALTMGLGERGRRWYVSRTSQDLGVPEDYLEHLLEYSNNLLQVGHLEGEGEDWEAIWETLKKAIRMQSEITLNDETDFPSLSSYSSAAISGPPSSDSTGSPAFPQTEVTGQSSSSTSAKKKKKKKKKKKNNGSNVESEVF